MDLLMDLFPPIKYWIWKFASRTYYQIMLRGIVRINTCMLSQLMLTAENKMSFCAHILNSIFHFHLPINGSTSISKRFVYLKSGSTPLL